MVEVGDIIKFAELAWTVVDYGWSPDLNATRQYLEFGHDLEHLAESLESLTGVIERARQSFGSRLTSPPPPSFGWDRNTLFDIVGDFDATLRECHLLVKTNMSYAADSGLVKNLWWNAIVMPSVERLRHRILMHHSKIQHFLRPFEIDLHLRIHNDLAQRMDEVLQEGRHTQSEVRIIRRDIEALKRYFDPSSLISDDQAQNESALSTVAIPEVVQEKLERLFTQHPDREFDDYGGPLLRDTADAFVSNFDTASPLYNPDDVRVEEAGGTEKQYIALLTCQFLMDKMLASDQVLRPPQVSHWPRYVQSLQQQLCGACKAFNQSMMADAFVSNINNLSVSAIWEEEVPAPYIESATMSAAMEQILQLPLKTSSSKRWREMKLFRYCDGTDRHFRMIITAGDENQPAAETRPVDFDLTTASLVPRYASPDEDQPLEMVLKLRDEMFPLEFFSRDDLYRYQQALTGYEVVDDYMAVKIIFVIAGGTREVKEVASLQLWSPARVDGTRVTDDPEIANVNDGDDGRSSFSHTPARSCQGTIASSSSGQLSSRRPGPSAPRSRPSNHDTVNITPSGSNPSFSTRVQRDHSQPTRDGGTWRDPWSSNSGTATRQSARSSTLSRMFTLPQRTSAEPRSPSRPLRQQEQQQQQQPSHMRSRSSLSSNSSSSSNIVRSRDRPASSSAPSVISTATSVSTVTTRAVSVSGSANVAAFGTLHCKPAEPVLVLFTRGVETGLHGLVAVSLEQHVEANYHGCWCTKSPGCCVTVIEVIKNGRREQLPVLRLGGTGPGGAAAPVRWDILSLAEAVKNRRTTARTSEADRRETVAWQRVIRVTMCFATVDRRKEFSGKPCSCPAKTEGELMTCLGQGHRGRLGLVKESFRRGMVEWFRRRYRDPVNVVEQPWQLGPED